MRAAWQSIRTKVEGQRAPLRGPLGRAAVDAIEGNAVVLKMPDTLSADILRDHTKLIETAILDVLGRPLKVTLRVESVPAAKDAARATAPPDSDDADELFNYASERIR